ncbi:nicotianamine synthase family protein [Alteribacillus sp. JSM 102045]|uniref:nicotianamine synthase family protein n=1 Tax=Alteribacillus sp. JSM 102045 TaxID=1562101 RepID=UPI0035BFCD83
MLYTMTAIEQHIFDTYQKAYHTLQHETDLSPKNPVINQTLSQLVFTLTMPVDQKVTDQIIEHPEIKAIRKSMLSLLAQAESEMEKYYAMHYLTTARSINDLTHFMYWNNYINLVQKEWEISQNITEVNRITMIGSGPLPLSALMMTKTWNAEVRCLDIDPFSHLLGEQLLMSLQGNDEILHEQEDGARADYSSDDLVLIASLVPNKEDILQQIKNTNPKAMAAIRSADGLYQLLYDPVQPEVYKKSGYQLIRRTEADSSVINSTLFLQQEK